MRPETGDRVSLAIHIAAGSMGMAATAVAIFRDIPNLILSGPLISYFVITGLTTLRPIPLWLQKPALMAIPALLPLVLMFYWLWRIRARKAFAKLRLAEG